MTAELTQYELREQLIADLPALMAEYEARHKVETLPIEKNRQLNWQVTHRVSCPERKEVLGPSVVVPGPKRKRGGQPGPKPRNMEIMRELVPLNLPQAELIARSGLSRPTVVKLSALVRAEIEEREQAQRQEALELIRTKAKFRREWRMRGSFDRWSRSDPTNKPRTLAHTFRQQHKQEKHHE